MNSLYEYIDNNYNEQLNTKKQYLRNWNTINDFFDDNELNIENLSDNDFKEIILTKLNKNKKNDKENSNSVKLQLLNIFIIYRHFIDHIDYKDLESFRNQLKNNQSTERVKNNKVLINELPSQQEVENFMNKQYKDGLWKNYIVNYLLTNFFTRNTDVNVRLFKDDPKRDDINYIAMPKKTEFIYVRNEYKTKSKYGKKVHKIKDVKFRNAIRNFLGDDDDKPLFLTKKSVQVSNRDCCWYVSNCTLNEIGEGKYLKIKLNDINNKTDTLNQVSKISSLRGTSMKHLTSSYNMTQTINDLELQ